MKTIRYGLGICAALMACVAPLQATAGDDPKGVYSSVDENGTVQLTNIPPEGQSPEPPANVDAAPGAGPDSHAKRRPAPVADAQTRALFESYRDKMIVGDDRGPASNPAVNRRYRMMDRETYRATLGLPPEGSKPTP